MIDFRIGSLLRPIMDATKLGKLDWEEDLTGGFAVMLGENTVNIYEMDGLFPGSNRRREAYTLRVLNKDRKVVDYFEYDETNPEFHDVQSFYSSVRRQVFKADLVLGDILGRLDTAH